MPAWGDVRRWEPAAIGGVADALHDRHTHLLAAGTEVTAMTRLDGWLGDAAQAASARVRSLVTDGTAP
jgi:phosphopantetheine adenylyltransferase